MSDPTRGHNGDEETFISELGPQLLIRFYGLMRAARLYDVSNQAFQRQLQEFMALLLKGLEDEHEISLVTAAGYFYLNNVRVKAQASLLSVYHSLMADFERRQLGGIRFQEEVTLPELERFLQLFMSAEDPILAERLPDAVAEASIVHIVPMRAQDIDVEELTQDIQEKESLNERGRARKVFWRAVIGTKKIVLRAVQTGRPDLRQAKRLVQPVVDSIMKNEYSIVGLTAVKDHDEYTYAHCVNVSVLSISMGQALGLPRQALADLGVAALLHDIGKLTVPSEVLQKPAALTPEEWALMHRHPIEGLKMMTRMPGFSTLVLDSMRVCLEHHMNYDRTGYPEITIPWGQATLSRIVAVADCFDAITAHRAYHKRPRSSFEGLSYMLGPSRVQFDPVALWALVRTVGLYPAGSVLLTESNHVVLSISPNPNDLRRPHCRLLIQPDGAVLPEDQIEMWDPMPDTQTVLRVLRPEDYENTPGLLAAA
jgi:HD-GYP domain-containing protein (c-di-GMP phosphodiesterase class II)